ncbi:MAG: Flp pilus assembly complex ATPase component TadA [Pirellulales bacterium]|nr:Flp pilus assembly complex ATPase component TadA [Pirellulales bacterium]
MYRLLLLLCVGIVLTAIAADDLWAQEPGALSPPGAAQPGAAAMPGAANAQPTGAQPGAAGAAFVRGSGQYMSWLKIMAAWLVFLMWVGTTDWVSRDCQEMHLQYVRWNPIVFGVFLGFYILMWLLPWFWLGFPMLLIAYVAPLTTYIIYRNGQVQPSDRVLTRDHIRFWLSQRFSGVEAEKKAAWEKGPPLTLEATGGETERDDKAHLLAARQMPGFNDSRGLLAEALMRRAAAIMLEYSQQSVSVRYMIDGVWHNDEPQERETCDPLLEALKVLTGLNPQERQARQKGTFQIEYDGIKYASSLASQGTQTGERVLLQFEPAKVLFKSLDDLGMREKMQNQLLELIGQKEGFILLSAMPASGLRSTTAMVLQKTDRFTREFMAVEDESNRYEPVENVPVTTYKSSEGLTPDSILLKVFRTVPDVVVIRDMVNAETVRMMCEATNDDKMFVGTIRAKDCAEALLRVLAMKVSPKLFAKSITAVLNQRLIRKLCNECKEAYAPTPQVLQQLGIPQGRVQAFYRPPQEPEEVCTECNGIGYKGRTAIFELMVVDDTIRKLLASGAKLDLIRKAAAKAGMQSLQAEGVVLVAKGITSLPELMRVMKQ